MPEITNQQLRTLCGLTLNELSLLVGLSRSTLCKAERGRRPLSPSQEQHIRRVLRQELGRRVWQACDALEALEAQDANPAIDPTH